MLVKKPLISLTAAAGIAALSSPATLATPCNYSATNMLVSCRNELREEYNATFARCNSISNAGERNGCKASAMTEREEAEETCADQEEARQGVCDALGENRYDDPLVDENIMFIDPDEIGDIYENNPYVKLEAGNVHVLRAREVDDETGETDNELIVVYATDEIREIEGVACRVVVDVALAPEFDEEEGEWEFEPIEVTDDWFAQDTDANVFYCGEVARNFEDGILRDLDGSFEAGFELAEGGFLTLAAPLAGDMHRQEYALGEAEDVVEYHDTDADPADMDISEEVLDEDLRCSSAGNTCLLTFDYAPLEPGVGEFKYYLEGTGFLLAAAIDDEGEVSEEPSEWLVCAYDSLEAAFADGSSCGFDEFEDPEGEQDPMDVREELLGQLCDLSDEFCDDGEEL